MASEYTFRPLSDRAWLTGRKKETSRFTASWSDTWEMLLREVRLLKGHDLVIGLDVADSDLRIDGELKARARPASDAVEVAFESKHGPLLYRAHQYNGTPWGNKMEIWQHNVRAIALTLESLRAVTRYGVSTSGEQYRGYRAIAAEPHQLEYGDAVEVLRIAAGVPRGDAPSLAYMLRVARRRTHPDTLNGRREQWDQVEAAAKVLGLG